MGHLLCIGYRQLLQRHRVGYGYFLAGHPSHRRIQIVKGTLLDLTYHFPGEPTELRGFFYHQGVVGLFDLLNYRFDIQRTQGAQIDYLHINAFLSQ